MASAIDITREQFSAAVESEERPVLIDFWAPWCSYCIKLAPVIDEIAEAVEDRAKCVKVNVDENAHLAERYGVMMLPTLVVAMNGKEVDRLVGAADKSEILSKLESYM